MNPDGGIYADPDPPGEDVARLDGYLRGLADGADDPRVQDAIGTLQFERDDAVAAEKRALTIAADERRARDLSDALRIEAERELALNQEDS